MNGIHLKTIKNVILKKLLKEYDSKGGDGGGGKFQLIIRAKEILKV